MRNSTTWRGRAPRGTDLGADPTAYRGNTEKAVADLAAWTHESWAIQIVTEGHGLTQRIGECCANGLAVRDGAELVPGVVTLAVGALGRGFLLPGARLADCSPRPTSWARPPPVGIDA